MTCIACDTCQNNSWGVSCMDRTEKSLHPRAGNFESGIFIETIA